MIHGVILAGGGSKRFRSSLSKVLHPLLGKPMLTWVVDLARQVPCDSLTVVTPQSDGTISEFLKKQHTDCKQVIQDAPRGTGHALRSALPLLQSLQAQPDDWVIVLYGDVPSLELNSLRSLIEEAERHRVVGTVFTRVLEEPRGYGRILTLAGQSHVVDRVVEERDCSVEQSREKRINLGIYAFRFSYLKNELPKLESKNAQGEFYLTDLLDYRRSGGIRFLETKDPVEGLGVNDRKQLADLSATLQKKIIDGWMERGVTFENPLTVTIGPDVKIDEDVVVGSGVKIVGATTISRGVVIEGHVYLNNTQVEEGSIIHWGSVVEDSSVGRRCHVGPYARIRMNSFLEEGTVIGNFVELKKTRMGAGSAAKHLTYLGDATLGKKVNVGCGVITCNYDGVKKHPTVIDDHAFIGSDCQLVAPVKIGKGAYIASGTTVNRDVPPGALAIGRVKQHIKPDYAERLKSRMEAKCVE